MAIYVELDASAVGGEEYWYGGYAEGDPVLGALAVSANSGQTAIAAYRVQSTGYLTAASSDVDCAPVAVRPTGALSAGTVTTFFGGNYISATGIIPFPSSVGYTFSQAIRTAGYRSLAAGTTIVNGRKKWETVDESSDIWTEVTY
jgi:hypothetical protein